MTTEFEEIRHKNKMAELTFLRESEYIRHQHILEEMRIKSAEIRKGQDRKYWNENKK